MCLMKSYQPGEKRRAKLIYGISIITLILAYPAMGLAQGSPILLASGLEYMDLVTGSGRSADVGDVVTVHLQGWLSQSGQKGQKFISTIDAGQAVSFKVGTERVMPAWNQGVNGMTVGGIRRLWVPAPLGFGAKGAGDVVPPNTDLIFEMELMDIQPSEK